MTRTKNHMKIPKVRLSKVKVWPKERFSYFYQFYCLPRFSQSEPYALAEIFYGSLMMTFLSLRILYFRKKLNSSVWRVALDKFQNTIFETQKKIIIRFSHNFSYFSISETYLAIKWFSMRISHTRYFIIMKIFTDAFPREN